MVSDNEFDYISSQLESWDFVIIAVYFIAVLVVGVFSSYKDKLCRPGLGTSSISNLLKSSESISRVWSSCSKSPQDGSSIHEDKTVETNDSKIAKFFLASESIPWIPVGASLFASNIGSEHFVGLAGSAAATGIAIATFEVNAIIILMLLGWFFVPVYKSAGVYTMPEYLVKRFGRDRIRIFLSILALLFYIFTKISADLYAGALFIKYSMGFAGQEGLYISILILLVISGFFCIVGGLTAVIWTDFIQTILMVIGAFILMGMTFVEVGGYQAIIDQYAEAEPSPEYSAFEWDPDTQTNKSCSAVRPDYMHFFHTADDGFLPWTGVLSGMFIASIYYWCTDQVIVQRLLAAKNFTHAKGGTLLAGALKILPMFLLVFPGMAARILFKNQVGCSDPVKCVEICGSEKGCSNVAYVFLVLKLMPQGLRGLMLAVMLAALMSSLTSIFNSSSTLFTIDVWRLVRKNASEVELVIVGRIFVVVLVLLSIAWIPIITSFSNAQLFVYIQSISSFLTPQVAATFLLAIFWHRTTEKGAFWGLMGGFACGLLRFGLEFSYNVPPCGSGKTDPRPEFVRLAVGQLHYLHFGVLVFLLTGILTIIISWVTEPIPEDKLQRLTFWTRHSKLPRVEWDERREPPQTADDNPQTDTSEGPVRRFFNLICFVGEEDRAEEAERVTPERLGEMDVNRATKFFQEDKTWKNVCNASAVGLLCVATFLFGFYA